MTHHLQYIPRLALAACTFCISAAMAAEVPDYANSLVNVYTGTLITATDKSTVKGISAYDARHMQEAPNWVVVHNRKDSTLSYRNVAYQTCLAVTRDGNVITATCNPSVKDQLFNPQHTDSGALQLENLATGTCLAISGHKSNSAYALSMTPCKKAGETQSMAALWWARAPRQSSLLVE